MNKEQATPFVHFTPRFASAWAAVTYLACTLSLAWPALFGRFLVNANSDQFIAGYAFREFAASFERANAAFPLWNPYLQGGMPFVAAMHGDTFYPTFLLRLIMPVDAAMSWGMVAHFFLCGMAAYWFLRIAARMSFFGALVGGLAYMMTGFVSSLLSAGHDGKLFVNALFPVLLIVLTWAIRDGRRWAFGATAIVVGLTLLTPHPQLFEQVMLVAAAWSLYLAFDGPNPLPRSVVIPRLAFALAAVAVGVAMGAIQYLPVVEYTAWSPRADAFTYEIATSYSFPLEELFNLYLPQFSGILDNYWGRNGIHFHSEYAGAAVLVLAGLGFGAATTAARRGFMRFWLGTGIVALLWALGGATPFYRLVYALVPMVKHMRAPSTIFYITAFAIAIFAAAGTERVLERRAGRRYLIACGAAALLVTLLALSGGLTSLAHSLVVIPQFADRVDAGALELQIGAVRSLVFTLLTLGTIAVATSGRLNGRVVGAVLAIVVAADLWTVERKYWGSVPSAATAFETDSTIEYLKAAAGADTSLTPHRTFSFLDRSQPTAPTEPYLVGDGLMVHRVRQTFGYHGNQIGRYKVFETDEMMFNPTTWALTNTKYLLINNDSVEIPGGRRVVGPVLNAAGTRVNLYELPNDNTFAWVTPAIVKYSADQVLGAIRLPNFPVRSVALVEPEAEVDGVNLTAIPAELPITVTTTAYSPGRISLSLSSAAPEGSALVVSENYYPGWLATVDGVSVKPERMDYVLIGVPLPAGARRVELTFTSPAYATGKAITLAALIASVLALVAGLFPFGRGSRHGDVAQGTVSEARVA
ncbi:MAG: YfhO family protein [Gemmatimonadetes bacterium]|nr:YfhO family protein [Gemmatimonadota bacterium]